MKVMHGLIDLAYLESVARERRHEAARYRMARMVRSATRPDVRVWSIGSLAVAWRSRPSMLAEASIDSPVVVWP
jgi:hypothetical protein